MGTLKIDGVDILNYTKNTSNNDAGIAHPAFPKKIKGVANTKIVTGWQLNDPDKWSTNADYDASKGRIKVNGTPYKVMVIGTRPRNLNALARIDGTGLTYYLNNVNGSLYLSTNRNEASGTFLYESKAENKDVVVTIVAWGSGGKGGGGAYWFLAGNWGGVGGAGGGKVLFTCCILKNKCFKIVTDPDDDTRKGRTSNSSDDSFPSPAFRLYKSNGDQVVVCYGGYSGVSNHPRWSEDVYASAGSYSVINKTKLPCILRMATIGGRKVGNGMTGNDCIFEGGFTEYDYGNPENYISGNKIILKGLGGKGPQTSYTQSQGSGGGASYGNGGAAGDTGSGSNGSAGYAGGGGGGSGSPAGGANGGDGGTPGCIILY